MANPFGNPHFPATAVFQGGVDSVAASKGLITGLPAMATAAELEIAGAIAALAAVPSNIAVLAGQYFGTSNVHMARLAPLSVSDDGSSAVFAGDCGDDVQGIFITGQYLYSTNDEAGDSIMNSYAACVSGTSYDPDADQTTVSASYPSVFVSGWWYWSQNGQYGIADSATYSGSHTFVAGDFEGGVLPSRIYALLFGVEQSWETPGAVLYNAVYDDASVSPSYDVGSPVSIIAPAGRSIVGIQVTGNLSLTCSWGSGVQMSVVAIGST